MRESHGGLDTLGPAKLSRCRGVLGVLMLDWGRVGLVESWRRACPEREVTAAASSAELLC